MLPIYNTTTRFHAVLRPLTQRLAAAGVTTNTFTLTAMFGSVAVGLWLAMAQSATVAWLLLSVRLRGGAG